MLASPQDGRPVRAIPSQRGDEVGRPELLRRVVDAVAAPDTGTVGLTTGLVGAGGFGKTTLARMVAHDPRVQERFVDGVVWITVGAGISASDLASAITSKARLFDGTVPQLAQPVDAGRRDRGVGSAHRRTAARLRLRRPRADLSVSPDGTRLAATVDRPHAGGGGQVRVWSTDRWQPLAALRVAGTVEPVVWAEDIVVDGGDRGVYCLRLRDA